MQAGKSNKFLEAFLLSLLIFSGGAKAAFNVQSSSTTSDPRSDEYYGNAQSVRFQKALEGGDPLTPEQEQELEAMLPERDDNRYYGSVHLNFGTISLNEIKNRSRDPALRGAMVNITQANTKELGLEFALGRTWKNWRSEFEILLNKNMQYDASPVLLNTVPQYNLTSQVKTNSLFLNAYYDFEGVNFFRPYLMGGLGVGIASAQSVLTNAQTGQVDSMQTFRSKGLGLNLGLGLRYRAFSRWDIDLRYRYAILGPVKWRTRNTFGLLGLGKLNVISLGVMYYF